MSQHARCARRKPKCFHALPAKPAAVALDGSVATVFRGCIVLSIGKLGLGVRAKTCLSILSSAFSTGSLGSRPASKGLRRLNGLGADSHNSTGYANVPKKRKTNKRNSEHTTSKRGGTHCSRPSTYVAPDATHAFLVPRTNNKKSRIATDSCSIHLCDISHSNPGLLGSNSLDNSSKVVPRCISRIQGSCKQTGWSIHQFCESCHGTA